ncbi:hypothetical protein JB92DRAFT_2752715, partial [Gautieria morchelliformis]
IHKSTWSFPKVLYLACRYYPLFVFPFQLWSFVFDHSMETCSRVLIYAACFLIPNKLTVVLLLRTYAFVNSMPAILVLLCACEACMLGYRLWVNISQIVGESSSRGICGNVLFSSDSGAIS